MFFPGSTGCLMRESMQCPDLLYLLNNLNLGETTELSVWRIQLHVPLGTWQPTKAGIQRGSQGMFQCSFPDPMWGSYPGAVVMVMHFLGKSRKCITRKLFWSAALWPPLPLPLQCLKTLYVLRHKASLSIYCELDKKIMEGPISWHAISSD